MRLILILLIASQCFGQSGWKTLIGKSLSWSDTTSTLATQYDLTQISGGPGGGQQYSDTTTYDATRSWVTGYLDSSKVLFWQDTTLTNGLVTNYDLGARADSATVLYWADTTLAGGIATQADISKFPDSSTVLYWADTTLTNGIATNYDVNARADSSTALYWADTTLANGPVTNYDLSQLFSPYTKCYGYVYKNPGQTTASTVGLVAPTLTATVASNDQTTGPFVQHTSAATINSPSGLISANFTVTRRDYEPDFYAVVRTGADISSLQFSIGLTSAAFDTNRAPNRYEIKFAFHTGVTGETTWQSITNNNSGAGQSKKDTGVTVATNTTYLMRIVCNTANAYAKFYINGNLVTTHTASLPTSTQSLGYGIRVTPTTAAARIINWSKVVLVWNG